MQVKILLYFIIYSFLGWCLESIYKTIIERKLVNSGFLHGPLCPIYGFGAIIMILLLKSVSNNILLIFLLSTILLTIWEYLVGFLLEKIFKTKYWDYSHLKFNLQGRICLKNSIYWGILGVIFIKLIHPAVEKGINIIPIETIFYIDIAVYIIFITDVIISVTKVLYIDKKINQVYELRETIKEKLQELKQIDIKETVNKEALVQKIEELKHRQAILKFKTYKVVVRLKKAFPTMQSEIISGFINPKIDLNKLKEKIKKIKEK